MARVPSPQSIQSRLHIVLIPGFGGFDALGQMEYYAGVTPQFRKWRDQGGERSRAVLHYFDNLPTASVATRAQLLRDWLAKRIVRGQFLKGDRVVLIGHSTGGLDIRRLIRDLDSEPAAQHSFDGAQDGNYTVTADEIRALISHVVFLSVPQWGTNIADWVRSYRLARKLVVSDLYANVFATQFPVLDKLEALLSSAAAGVMKTCLLYAVRDAMHEADAGLCKDEMQTALAQDAASELSLYLRHMVSDFAAIDDLAADAHGDYSSPAHFSGETRDEEFKQWDIITRSYATISKSPFRFKAAQAAPRWDLLNPCTYPEIAKDARLSVGTDWVYRMGYRACAGGPFQYPSYTGFTPAVQWLGSAKQRHLELWDNDGIVNTASMLWPFGETRLVECDHMDIVGHYRLVPSTSPESGREYDAYDLLGSASPFGEKEFGKVWEDAFEFCVSKQKPAKSRITVRTSIRTARGREQVYEAPVREFAI